jgi:hypothetical protein
VLLVVEAVEMELLHLMDKLAVEAVDSQLVLELMVRVGLVGLVVVQVHQQQVVRRMVVQVETQ